jgi:hypothetical protein
VKFTKLWAGAVCWNIHAAAVFSAVVYYVAGAGVAFASVLGQAYKMYTNLALASWCSPAVPLMQQPLEYGILCMFLNMNGLTLHVMWLYM